MTHSRQPPGPDKRVQLMATCLCDAFYADVARASVEVLEHLGCIVDFPEAQTCCGQPAFNGGDWAASRKVVRHTVRTFAGNVPVIVPSGSCAAMVFHGAPLEFEKESDRHEVEALANRTWELVDFIVNGLGVKTWPGRYAAKVAFHRSCHSRGTNSGEATTALLSSIAGLELIPFGEGEQCCGFGGTFSVSFPTISTSSCRAT
jgi:L-lactate dehydrogenase complex protein LldE